jgi:hypothetical protein
MKKVYQILSLTLILTVCIDKIHVSLSKILSNNLSIVYNEEEQSENDEEVKDGKKVDQSNMFSTFQHNLYASTLYKIKLNIFSNYKVLKYPSLSIETPPPKFINGVFA